MAGRGHKKKSLKNILIWSAGSYTRRSFDDLDNKESNTIINQKTLIQDFIKQYNDIEIVDYYVDDGYSGTTFNRPSFKNLLRDVVNGKINCIIVKDLSRLGRNYLEVGKYIEDIFPLYNVRFISINDAIDSYKNPESIQNISVAVKNLMNDEYAKDISKKVKSAYIAMAKAGKFFSGTAPFGYSLDPDDKHHLVINEQEASVVRTIFKMTIDGNGRIKICKYLNDNGILCRKELQRRSKRNLTLEPFDINSEYRWSTTQIGRILKNEVYIGNLVQCKTGNISYKVHKLVEKPKDEWIIVNNTHEAIIDKQTFKKVQSIMKEKRTSSCVNNEYSIYNKKIKCSNCGRAMYKQTDTRGNREVSNYYCSNHLRTGNICSPHKIKTKLLDKLVLEAIQLQIKLVIELDKTIERVNLKDNKKEKSYEYDIKDLSKKIDDIKSKKKIVYEKWKFNEITQLEYSNKIDEYNDDIKKMETKIYDYKLQYQEYLKKIKKNDYWISHYKRNRRIKKLSKEIIEELIDSIIVFEDESIKVTFKYNDEYEELLSYVNKVGDNND